MPIDNFYSYMDDQLTNQPLQILVKALEPDGDNPESYPVFVYNAVGAIIGAAGSKQDYIDMWNSDPSNQQLGTLTGYYGEFTFILATTVETIASLNIETESIAESDYLIDADGAIMQDADGIYMLTQ
jgi:hypothetical protein